MDKQAAIAVADPPYTDGSETAKRRRTIEARLYENGPDLDGRMFLSDANIEFLARFYPFAGKPIILKDQANDRDRERNAVPGLEIRIGARKATWRFVRDTVDHGERDYIKRTLGHFDTSKRVKADWHMGVKEAREEARKIAGLAVNGLVPAGKRTGRKFGEAFQDYLLYLKEQAEDNGKPPRWMQRVARLGNSLILPKWEKWTLAEMSECRAELAEWYRKVSPGRLTSANHAIRVIRAIYIREAKRDDSLSGDPTKLPSAAVKLRTETWQKKNTVKPGMAGRDFPAWLKKWRTLPPIRRAYHLTNLLTGARPGELARTPWSNLDTRSRTLTIGDSKAGHDIPIPLSVPICRALKLARDLADKSGLIFPGCEQAGHHEPTFTKAERGHSHRRTWKTVATDCKIADEMSALVLGHIPEGMSAKYAIRQMLLQGRALRGYQRQVSARMLELFGEDPTILPADTPPRLQQAA
jgi:integrase